MVEVAMLGANVNITGNVGRIDSFCTWMYWGLFACVCGMYVQNIRGNYKIPFHLEEISDEE